MGPSAVVGLLLIGAAGGFPIGRFYAEVARARFDANKAWNARTAYRDKKD